MKIGTEEQIQMPELEACCDMCGGSGSYRLGGRSYKCPTCRGDGKVVTPFGEKLLSFVWKRSDEVRGG